MWPVVKCIAVETVGLICLCCKKSATETLEKELMMQSFYAWRYNTKLSAKL